MGPPQAQKALREALSLGIDEAVHLCDRAFAGSDTWATSRILSRAIEHIADADLVICGKQSSDGDTAQVGPGVAAHLTWPQATYVRKIESIDLENRLITVQRLLEEGYEVIAVGLPCLITVVKEINEPRLPSLRGKLRARGQNIPVWTNKDLGLSSSETGLDGSPTQVRKIFTPPPRTGGLIFDDPPKEAAAKLVEELRKYLL